MASASRSLQKKVMKVKDERIKVENEVLGGMKIIKLYAWERPFGDKIDSVGWKRSREWASTNVDASGAKTLHFSVALFCK